MLKKMQEKAEVIGEEQLPPMKAGQNQNIGTQFLESFPKDRADKMQQILKNGRYIPQEILSIEDF